MRRKCTGPLGGGYPRAAFISILLLLPSVALAGEATFFWTPADRAAGYRLYLSTTSGQYGPPIDMGVPPDLHYTVDSLQDGCVKHYAIVTAYNVAGEGELSNEVEFTPRPIILSVMSQGGDTWIVSGGNFATNSTVEIDGDSIAFTRVGCEQLSISVLAIPESPTYSTLTVCNPYINPFNPDHPGICQSYLLVPSAVNLEIE